MPLISYAQNREDVLLNRALSGQPRGFYIDVGANDPSGWAWGGTATPDVMLALFAAPGGLSALRASLTAAGFDAGFAIVADLATTDMKGAEPFGFADGISQPEFDFAGTRTPGTDADLGYGNLLAAGELLLGHRDEYGQIIDRPLVDPALPGAADLPVADGGRRDLGRNGSYLVFRQLEQDVAGFWRFAAANAATPAGAVALAESMVGRRRSGDALLPASAGRVRRVAAADLPRNGFTFDADPDGARCPLGAHIRRANPRTGDMPGGVQGAFSQGVRMLGFGGDGSLREDAVASSRFHRILRRGREYGTWTPPEQAMALPAGTGAPAAGLHFICLNASIARQFEFIQNAWLASAKFDAMSGEADPLLGNREPFPAGQRTDGFGRLCAVPRFVTVRGGGYFFLPGLRALRFIAGLTG